MADTSGEADIRGIDVDKFVKGFADIDNIFKKFANQSKTKAREIRWYKKTSGFLDVPTTTGITQSLISNTSEGSQPAVMEQSWTRQTSYVRKFFVESPTFTIEDIKDSDIDVLGTNMRDIVRGVSRKVDLRWFSVLTEAAEATPTVPAPSTTNNGAATADGWNDATTGDPIGDINTMEQAIFAQGYQAGNAPICMNSLEYKFLKNYLINVKGSSIPNLSSKLAGDGVLMEVLGHPIIVSENWTTDCVGMFIKGRTMTYKSFMPLTAVTLPDPGIGVKIRVWEEGEFLLTDPKSAYILTDTTV